MRLENLPDIYALVNGRDLITVAGGVSVRDAAELMTAKRIGAVVVCDDQGDTIGIFTERDVMTRVVAGGRDPAETPVGAVMTPDPETIALDAPVDAALSRMLDSHFRHLPVVDQQQPDSGTLLVGIISARDVLRMMREQLAADGAKAAVVVR